jgi:hypothetical protein
MNVIKNFRARLSLEIDKWAEVLIKKLGIMDDFHMGVCHLDTLQNTVP